jgi:Arc/MetJ-type ribon-helix-helix transcriptional regulator
MRVDRTRDARIAVRVSTQDQVAIEQATRARGYSSPSAFIRAAIRNELHGREELTAIEERIGASFERMSNENVRLGRAMQALFALLDALSKTVLTCIPEPPLDANPQAVALARERYHRLIKSAGLGMSGDSQATMENLVSHDSGR